MDEEVLHGGVANKGAVTRLGPHVLRPASKYSAVICSFLTAIRKTGFKGASEPAGYAADGRERMIFIEGDVPLPPYPEWAQTDEALTSTSELMRDLHQASASFEADGSAWSDDMGDSQGGAIVCHNDVCLENVVFRDGRAVGLLDFDFASPGRPVFDLAAFASRCVPINDGRDAAQLGWLEADRPRRLRLVADAYGLNAADRGELLTCVDSRIASGGQFVRRRIDAGDQNFIDMMAELGGMEFFDRRQAWWAARGAEFAKALV